MKVKGTYELGEYQISILQFLSTEEWCSAEDLQKEFGWCFMDIYKHIDKLVALGLVEQEKIQEEVNYNLPIYRKLKKNNLSKKGLR